MKNLTQLPWSGKCSKAKNDNTLGRMRGGIRSRIGSMSLKSTSLFGVILALLLTFGAGEMKAATIFNCGIDVNDTWYKGTGTINSGNWLGSKTAFNGANLGALTSMTLGGQYDTWDNNQTDYCSWNGNNGIHILIKKGSTQIANFKLTCYHDSKDGNNNVWKTKGGTGSCSDSGSWGTYTVDISGYAAGNDYTIKATWTSPSSQSNNATANFTINPVVTFKANGGTGSDYTQRVTYNTNTALTSNTFSKTGYDFAGWATSADGSVVYANGANVKLTAHTTLFAKWTPKNYTITLDKNGGTADGSVQTTYASTATASLSAPTWSGYHVTGYYSASSAGTLVMTTAGVLQASVSGFTDSNGKWTATNSPKLYAYWAADAANYTITYGAGTSYTSYGSVSEGHSYASGSSQASGTEISLTATPVNAHYKLEGWYSDATCSSAIAGAGTTNPYEFTLGANTSVYAKFVLKQCVITLDKNGGSTGATSVTATHGSTLPSFTAHGRSGYTLNGYYTETSGGTKIINADGSLVASTSYANGSKQWNNDATALTLHAQWTENKSTVSLVASPTGAGTFTSGSAVTSVLAGVATKPAVTAVPVPGYKFTSWAVSGGATISSTSTNPTTVTGKGAGADATLTATFVRKYAFIEGRFTVANSARNSDTHTGSSAADWSESSTNIAMDYDATNHRFYRHTYKTPAQLKAQQSGYDQWFSFKTSTTDGALSGTITTYHPSSNTDLTTAGYSNKKSTQTSTTSSNYKFNNSGTTGYVILYFDESNVWYELEHTLTYNGNGNTSGSVPAAETYYDNGATVTTLGNVAGTPLAKTGYNFSKWNTKANGSGTNRTAESTWPISENTTLYAQWTAKTYTITLDKQTSATGYGTSGTAANPTATYDAALPAISGTMPSGTGTYGFMGFYTGENGTGSRLTDASGVWIASVDGYTDADKKWIHDGDVTLYAYYKQAEISELTPAPAIIAPGETVTVTPTLSPAPAGTHIICWELQYSNGTALPSQPTFTPGVGNAVSFPAPSASATYRIQATLRSGSSCGGGSVLSTRVATFQVAGDHTVTVQYKCGDMTIAESVELDEIKPLIWSDGITAPSITGYTFSGWVAGDGVTIKEGESSTATTHIKATYDGTLTANYTRKRMIYFYNTLNWSNVYVYFYKNNSYWNNSNGTGADNTYTFTNTPYSEQKHGQMLPIEEGSKIYYFDAEAAGVNASYTTVAFTELNQHGYGYFAKTDNVKNKVIRRDDYKSTTMPMFVPLDQTPTTMNGGLADYYNNGYWMNYPENSGYTLKIYDNAYASKTDGAVRSIAFPYSTTDLKLPLKMDVEFNDANHEYWFMVYRNDGTYLGNTYNFKQGWNEEQVITGGDNKSKITTSAPGNYTLTLTYHDENYYIDVDFPIASGDYRIYYSDNATWSQGAHTKNSWNHPSHSIAKATTEAKKDTVSFFIPKGDGISHTMKFQKASVTNEGVVSWSDVASGSITIPSSVTSSGVYNFIVSQPAGGASISLEKVEPYTGNFYIRTDCAGNTKWDSFKNLDHQMTYSDYAEANSGYSHYYAHWVESGNNVSFTIANDYSMCVSDTLTQDYGTTIANISAAGALNSGNASIRFMWNKATNKISRAYISGSSNISDRFLVLEGDARMFDENGNALSITGLNANEINLVDDQNFVYERTIKVQTGAEAKLTAKYNDNVQYFIGGSGSTAADSVVLLGGTASATKYSMRIVYDFKTNRLVKAYIPSGADIKENLAINADIMLVREHQNAGQQLTFDGGSLSEVKTVYGVMRFNRWTLNNKSTAAGHAPVGDPKSTYERSLYWISFPFDVNLSDVFGFGTYGTHWIIEYYDGAERAKEGYWKDSEGFWKYITNRRGVKLEAGKGYILALDLDLMRDNNTSFWANDIQQVELFFPSVAAVENIKETNTEIDVPAHECTIAPRPGQTDDRRKKDSHWNIIGVPSYANYGETLKDGEDATITWNDDPKTKNLPFLYEWNTVDNSYSVQSGRNYPFKSMHAYMVQYNGKLKWSLASATPVSPVVARHADAPQDVEFRLELQAGEKVADQTFVKMTTDEQISTAFDFNYDLSKQMNSGKANIYTMVEGYIQTAGNCLPMSEQTTVVPVGVKIAVDGDYTFAIPEGTEGVGVTLIDQERGIRTSLSALAYTVTLEAGTYDERFVLEISPIHNVPTEQSAVRDQQADVRKVLIDGLLYIVRDNKMYDARGAMVMEK